MNATGKRRLLKLAEFLETKVPARRFDMSEWVTLGSSTVNPRECGFAGCAIGWSTAIPSFRRAGFHINDMGQPAVSGYEAWKAVCFFFDLEDRGQAEEVFSMLTYPNNKATPKQVAKRIRKMVASHAS